MTIHVPIAELRDRIDELIDAVKRGEDVVIEDGGAPKARLVGATALPKRKALSDEEAAAITARRRKAFGMYKHLVGDHDIDVRALKPTDDELEADFWRNFGPPR